MSTHAAVNTHVDHGEPGMFKKYFWSTDHKVIAMQYLFTGMAMAIPTNCRRVSN